MSSKITTSGRITILLGKHQAATGERVSPRKLAEKAGVPKDFVYRLDSGAARHVDLDALAHVGLETSSSCYTSGEPYWV